VDRWREPLHSSLPMSKNEAFRPEGASQLMADIARLSNARLAAPLAAHLAPQSAQLHGRDVH
jgi:hypothetical protein